jgi:Na+-translocating ferredoxin:NAD+ oxidoreductase subunit G
MNSAKKIPAYRTRLGYHSGLLGGMALLAGMVLIIADVETRDAIALAKAEDQRATLAQVIPHELHDNSLLHDTLLLISPDDPAGERKTVYLARQGDYVRAAAFQVADQGGYSGLIQLIMAVDIHGTVLGVRVLNHAETPGLGDKIEVARDDWILSFNGLSFANTDTSEWTVKKDGGRFDQFTGATITPRAVVRAVKRGLEFFATHKTAIIEAKPPQPDEIPAPVPPTRSGGRSS